MVPAHAGPDDVAHARAIEARGDLAAAAAAYAEALARTPDDREAALGLGRTAARAPAPAYQARAERALQALFDAQGDDLDVRLALGELLLARATASTSSGVEGAAALGATTHLRAVVDARPDDEDAALLLARALAATNADDEAVDALDRLLGHAPDASLDVLVLKGRLLYEHGRKVVRDAGGGWPVPEAARRLFERARGTLDAASSADPSRKEAWILLAWTDQMLGERDEADAAYAHALVLEPEDPLPLRGVIALHQNDPTGLSTALGRLAHDHPALVRVLLVEAWVEVGKKDGAKALPLVEACLAERPEDADALELRGEIAALEHDEAAAVVWWRRALAADPRQLAAAESIDRRIRADGLAKAKATLDGLHEVEHAYEDLLARAPTNPYVWNNLAFLLREAWSAHAADEAWRPVLDASVRAYEEATRAVGPWSPEAGRGVPWARRYAFAQIVCDTGVILYRYEPVQDLVRAEARFLASLAWSDDGYLDAWTYLSEMYEKAGRYDELYRRALRAAESLAGEDHAPLVAQREAARALALRLVAEGKVTPDAGR